MQQACETLADIIVDLREGIDKLGDVATGKTRREPASD
jgi:hypothetical protein